MSRAGVVVLATMAAIGVAGAARADDGCGAGQHMTRVDLASVVGGRDAGVAHLWGRRNGQILPAEPGTSGPVLRVSYPKGSANPGDKALPEGGLGFEYRSGSGLTKRCLSYKVRFPVGFDFVKGGKLPGLYGGDAPRGCTPKDLSSGFSARLMWRTGGAGELYLYSPDRSARCGDSIERGAWTFTPGRWVAIAEEITLNAPGAADGSARIWIDGKRVIEKSGLTLRASADIGIDGVLFSTFFGGSDASWASPADQTVDFADIVLR